VAGQYSARGATLGGRSLKSGQSRWFIGYKKHTLRLWLRQHDQSILLAPLVSWAVPAHRGEALFLLPSLRYCATQLQWTPDIVVGDMAYINRHTQQRLREQWRVAVVTKLRPDMTLPKEFDPGPVMKCKQGQTLEWLGLHEAEQLHWFGVTETDPLCRWCWQQSSCPREFSFSPSEHEILYGTIPLSSRVAQQLLGQARSWIEATQSYEKNQLGLSQVFLNSLRLTWIMSLLADTVALLRARALLTHPQVRPLLQEIAPTQMSLDLE
jgi:hypothetical protein